MTNAVDEHLTRMRKAWYVLGCQLWECERLGVPAALGLKWDVWLSQRPGYSKSSCYNAKMMVKALSEGDSAILERIPEQNARFLSMVVKWLPKPKRLMLIERAAELDGKEFKTLAIEVVNEATGTPMDERRVLSVNLPRGVYDLVADLEVRVAVNMGMDLQDINRAQVWEWVI